MRKVTQSSKPDQDVFNHVQVLLIKKFKLPQKYFTRGANLGYLCAFNSNHPA